MISLNGVGDDDQAAAPPTASQQTEIDGFLASTPTPSSADIAQFLKLYGDDDRQSAAQALITRGVDPDAVARALRFLDTSSAFGKSGMFNVLSIASAAASGFHGVRRHNGSVGWGIWWFLMGGLFPVITPVVAVAQGFAKPKAG